MFDLRGPRRAIVAACAVTAVIITSFALRSVPAHADSGYQAVTDDRLAGAATDDGWLMYLRTYDGQAHVPFTQITADNVAQLKEVFTYDIPIPNGFEAPPIVNGNEMILSTPLNHIYAFDATTGKVLWKYDYPLPKKALRTVCCDVVNRGVALYGNNLYFETLDNHVVALDAATGKVVWNKAVYPESGVGYFMTGAPLLVKGKLIVGDGGGEYGARGFVAALDPATGAEKWRRYTIPSPSEPGGDTWPGKKYLHGGGSPWVTGTYDAETNTLLWGVGNPGPWLAQLRTGKNLYTDSVLGLDPDTGAVKWYFQETPNDPWDYDAVGTPILADVTIAGTPRKVFYQAARNGWFFVVDRTNGKLIHADPFTKVTTVTGYDKDGNAIINKAAFPSEGKQVTACPAFFGGNNWWSESFDPKTGYAFVSTMKTCMTIAGQKSPDPFKAGLGYLDETFAVAPVPGGKGWGALQAIDVATGKQVWTHDTQLPWNDGQVSTDTGLVFSGSPDQKFFAFDSKTGKVLWTHHMSSGVIGQPVSYQIGGKQYVAVTAGWGGVSPLWGGPKMVPQFKNIPLGGKLYVFALP
jgi:alcohol dehydrogenase (cytochrome c)